MWKIADKLKYRVHVLCFSIIQAVVETPSSAPEVDETEIEEHDDNTNVNESIVEGNTNVEEHKETESLDEGEPEEKKAEKYKFFIIMYSLQYIHTQASQA